MGLRISPQWMQYLSPSTFIFPQEGQVKWVEDMTCFQVEKG